MWRNWNPLNPPVNEQSSDEYESPQENKPDLNELVSPQRPHQSPSASPRALLRPDPPPVEEVLGNVERRLRALPDRNQRAQNRNAHRRAQEEAEAAAEAAAAANMVDVVEFERENGVDGAKASELGRQIKVEFSTTDIRFWFAELEAEMTMATIKGQWLKKTVLQRNLPTKQKEDVKALLTLTQAQAGDDIYLKIKNELIRIYAPKAKDSYCKALTRTMVGLPSQLGNQLVDDVCKKADKLNGCCCASAVEALWQLQLPVGIRAHVSNLEFSHATYKQVFEAADKVFMSSKQVAVAALSREADLNETQAAFNPENQPQVAAVSGGRGGGRGGQGRGRGGNRGGRGNRGGGGNGQARGGGAGSRPRGPRHASNPPEQCCDRHYVHGADAWYCVKPSTCPWKDKVAPRD